MALWSNTDAENSKPKYLSTADKAKTFGVDVAEQAAETSQGQGPAHAGWVLRNAYTDSLGNPRVRLETLVAMGSMTSDLEDVVMQDLNIVIGTQPANDSNATGAVVEFAVVASTVPTGGTIGFQWQVSTDSGSTWANLSNTGVYSTVTTDVLHISDNTGLDGNQYRVTLSATGATTVNSAAATLTEAA